MTTLRETADDLNRRALLLSTTKRSVRVSLDGMRYVVAERDETTGTTKRTPFSDRIWAENYLEELAKA